jgi:glucose/mannose transport system substrate-binding protein
MDMAKFDDCAKASTKDFVRHRQVRWPGAQRGPRHGHQAPATEGAIKDAVSQFWNDDKISVADGVKNIAKAAATK